MRTLAIVAMIVAGGMSAQANASSHRAQSAPPHSERFMGLYDGGGFAAPRYDGRGRCNGGACTLTGGPSGGPNQS